MFLGGLFFEWIQTVLILAGYVSGNATFPKPLNKSEEKKYLDSLDSYRQRYIEKMDDDFNTADAISVLFDLARDVNTNVTINSSKELCEKALELIKQEKSYIESYDLSNSVAAKLGMACGGTIKVLLEYIK